MADNHTGRRFAIGALIAGAAGYVAGILTAPKSGKETRKDIADKAGEVKDQAVEDVKMAQAELNKMLHLVKDKTQSLSAGAKAEYNEAVVRAKDARNKSAAVLKAVKAGESDDRQLNQAVKNLKQAKKNLGKYLKK